MADIVPPCTRQSAPYSKMKTGGKAAHAAHLLRELNGFGGGGGGVPYCGEK